MFVVDIKTQIIYCCLECKADSEEPYGTLLLELPPHCEMVIALVLSSEGLSVAHWQNYPNMFACSIWAVAFTKIHTVQVNKGYKLLVGMRVWLVMTDGRNLNYSFHTTKLCKTCCLFAIEKE